MADSVATSLTKQAARAYEDFFVPALFGQWAERVAATAGIRPGDRVLDVACGTGVLARVASRLTGDEGSVTGLDASPAMLAVAAEEAPGIAWRRGTAESLPFEDDTFDVVVSQFGLMFFDDPGAAIREMQRVLRPEGRLAVAVWDRLDRSPGYVAFVDVLERLFGAEVADGLRAPFALGDRDRLGRLFAAAGVDGITIESCSGTARFPSVRDWVHADGKGWLQLDDARFERLAAAAETDLRGFAGPDGAVAFEIRAHVIRTGPGLG